MAARARGGAALTRPWKIGLGIVATLVAIDLALRFLGSVTGGTPGGPRSSSYATGRTGLGAYAELLGHSDHPVDRLRKLPHSLHLDPAETVVLLDPPFVAERDALALRDFVAAGGRLVAGGADHDWLRSLLARPPAGVAEGVSDPRVSSRLAHVRRVETAASGAWSSPGSTEMLLGSPGAVVLAEASIGRGRALLLADASPLQNRLLDHRDNAQLGLDLAGPRGRPVAFLETYHGYGSSSGLRALPVSWKLLLAGLALAALVYMVARGRRLGPPESPERELPPPRREYVDALAATLARTRKRDEAVAGVRVRAREAVLRRAGLPPDADDDALQAAARRLGVPDEEVAALVGHARTDEDVLAVGRALAHIGHDLPRR
jgi:hypothetical protein